MPTHLNVPVLLNLYRILDNNQFTGAAPIVSSLVRLNYLLVFFPFGVVSCIISPFWRSGCCIPTHLCFLDWHLIQQSFHYLSVTILCCICTPNLCAFVHGHDNGACNRSLQSNPGLLFVGNPFPQRIFSLYVYFRNISRSLFS